jgi:hypothetical protein
MRKFFAVWFSIPLLIAGCGTIQTYERLVQPTESELNTYIGGPVFRIERSSDLPNVVGKADIWGGKVDRGFVELRYQGVAPDGKLLFRVTDIETRSNETTMSRYGLRQSTVNATTTVSPTGTSANTFGTVTTVAPQGQTQLLGPNTTEFAFDVVKSKVLTIAGVTVRIVGFDAQSLRYVLVR